MKKYLKYGFIMFVILIFLFTIPSFAVAKESGVQSSNWIAIMVITTSVLGIVLSFLLWHKYGDDDPIVKTECRYAPENLNSAELCFFYNGETEIKDIMTLLVYLATKGYLKIEQHDENVLFTKDKTFKIVKLKEYDGKNVVEKEFFDELFKCGKDFVTENDLINKFYKPVSKIDNKLESKKNRKKIFDENGNKKGTLVLILGLIVYVFFTFIPLFDIYGKTAIAKCAICGIFQIFGVYILLNSKVYIFNKIFSLLAKIYYYLISLIFIMGPAMYIILGLNGYTTYLISYVIGLVSFVIIMSINKFMPKRTKYGTEILGKIEGFKEFIENINDSDIEMMMEENKNYFYDILPYIYMFNYADTWFEKFESKEINKPEWYECEGEFELKELKEELKYLINLPMLG